MGKTRKERDPVQEIRDRMAADGWTPERRAVKRTAWRELQGKYPGMYAVIREEWDGEILVEPYLLAVAASQEEIDRLAEQLPADQSEGAVITYIWPNNKAMGF